MVYRLSLVFFLFLSSFCTAQSLKDFIVDPSYNGKIFLNLLHEIEKAQNIDFICDESRMKALTVSGITEKQRVTEYLDNFFRNFLIKKVNDRIYFIIDAALIKEYGWSNKNFVVLKKPDASRTTISGTIIDGTSKEALIGARVYFPALKQGMLTDTSGEFFVPEIPTGIEQMDVNYVGYESQTYIIGFSPYADATEIPVHLFSQSKELQSVTITADRIDENVTGKVTGIEKLSIETIKSLPTFLGEVDPIRSLTTLPGVTTSGELASGFNVRGGEVGQNLVLQDGAIIYNPSHLFGFFSAFNPDMVNNVVLYKGGGPASFGSRVSSVLDISLRNGDAGKHTVSGGIGLVSSRLTLEGPIVKNKSSYLIGGRVSYANWLLHANDNIALKNSAAKFRDLTAKIFHTFNQRNYLTVSFYNSYDDFKFATDSIFGWSTQNFSAKWDHTFTEKLFSSLTAFSSAYSSHVQSVDLVEAFTYSNAIKNNGAKYDISYNLTETAKISAGIEGIWSLIDPGKLVPSPGADNVIAQNMNDQHMFETDIYLNSEFNISQNLSATVGMRYSDFHRLGSESVYIYDYNNFEGRYPSIVDSVTYKKNESIQHYAGIEPRVSLRYLVTPSSSVKASYYRTFQYMHLISNRTSATPQDYWIASGPYLKPQIGTQYSLGFFKNLKHDSYEISTEGFYKNIVNAVDYIEGADITLNPALEAGLTQGKGLAYGVEVTFKKKVGKFNGWLAYTYSRSLRKFEPGENKIAINNGKYYASAFDQPNILSVVMNYRLGLRTSFAANFNYSTGRPITIPISKFSYDVYLSVLNYSQRNEYRIPDYHRLDVSITIKDKPKKIKRFKSEWVISVFNVYGRKNTYSIYFDRYGTAKKLSVLGSVFPSVTYGFRF
jgi:hypothetical protein